MSQKYNSLPTGEYDDNETSGKSSQQLQYDRRKRQDDSLEALGGSVLRLGQLSLGISEEIDSQNKLLEGLDTELDTANQNVDRITQMTKALVKKSGGSRGFCIIIVLSIILVFLVFLCIYSWDIIGSMSAVASLWHWKSIRHCRLYKCTPTWFE